MDADMEEGFIYLPPEACPGHTPKEGEKLTFTVDHIDEDGDIAVRPKGYGKKSMPMMDDLRSSMNEGSDSESPSGY